MPTMRPAHGPADLVDGVMPGAVCEPETAEEAAEALVAARDAGHAVVIRGGGTKIGWGRTPAAVDVMLSTRRLDRLVAHEHADLTATVQAGARLGDVNRMLAEHGQFLPIQSAFDDATIGGIIATNDSGPLRHRYGAPRDVIIGMRVALCDGRVVKAGGNVVKNVAGYDIGRLMSGSFGSLAFIASATFKLSPLPRATSTVVADFDDAAALVRAITAVGASQLEPAAFDLHATSATGGGRLLARFESTPRALTAHVTAIRAWLNQGRAAEVSGEDEGRLWQAQTRAPFRSDGLVVRAHWKPAHLEQVLGWLAEVGGRHIGAELTGRVAMGLGTVHVRGSVSDQLDVVRGMRARPGLFRHVVVVRADAAIRAEVDPWGELGDAGHLHAAIKSALDPRGTLNAGRGPV